MARSTYTLTRLVVLWLLSEGALHGYRIKRILEDPGLRFWFPVEYASIYSVLRTMVKDGLVRIQSVEREGRRPIRTRYAITGAGRRHFAELLERAWRLPPDPADPIQLALAAQPELGEERVKVLIDERAEALRQRLDQLEGMARSAPAGDMVSRQVALTQAELLWLEGLRMEKEANNG